GMYLVLFLIINCLIFFFFFSSRRRHTRWPRDWSSDVCSSDLGRNQPQRAPDRFCARVSSFGGIASNRRGERWQHDERQALLKKSRALSVPQPARSQRWSSLSHQRGCAFAEFHHHGVLRNHFRHVLLVFVLRQKFCAERVE